MYKFYKHFVNNARMKEQISSYAFRLKPGDDLKQEIDKQIKAR